ncbi:MAG: tetratricopeptide repeat protein [Nitrospiraceae bacterium]
MRSISYLRILTVATVLTAMATGSSVTFAQQSDTPAAPDATENPSSPLTAPEGAVQEEALHPPQPVKPAPPPEPPTAPSEATSDSADKTNAVVDETKSDAKPAAEATPKVAPPTATAPSGPSQAAPPTASAQPAPEPPIDETTAEASDEPPSAPPTRSPLLFEGDYLTSVDRLRKALRIDPSSTDTRFALGQALFGLGDVDAALEEFKQVVQVRPTSIPARLHLATALMAKRRWKDAQKELTTILAQDKQVAAAHHNLGAVRYSQGDVKGAIEAYRAALAVAPDSVETHYNLGVVLRLAGRWKEATPELLAAAEAGHPKAQYFLGSAYHAGTGADRDLTLAIRWWMAAAEHGVPEAQDALSRLRKIALKPNTNKEAPKTLKAFTTYRQELWFGFPELTPSQPDETVGIALLQAFRIKEAVPTLIREATAMGELSERYLAALYEQGLPSLLAPFDPRILRYFESSAGDGSPQAKLALARFHALGLGVQADRTKALSIIKGLPSGYAEQFLQDLAARPAGSGTTAAPTSGGSPASLPQSR